MTLGGLEAALHHTFRFNPCVTVHELRLRVRGWRPFIVMLGYTAVACAAVLIALSPAILGGASIGSSHEFGRTGFIALAYTQLSLVLLILPAYAAGAISLERERRTLEMLRATLVSSSDVVTGKLLVVLAFGLMLLITSLPVAAWCLLLGGVAPEEVLYVYGYLFTVGAVVSTLGLAYSARMSRSISAVVATYGTIIAFSVLTIIIPGIGMMLWHSGVPASLSPIAVFATTFIFAVLAGLVVYSLLRSVARRFLRKRWLGLTLALVAALGLVFLLTQSAGIVSRTVSGLHSSAFMALNPFVGLGVLLYSDMADQVLYMSYMGSSSHAPLPESVIWLVLSGLWLLAAAAFYSLSIRSFARRPD